MIASDRVPRPLRADMARGRRLAWWTLFWVGNIAVIMFLAMGSSQAMKSAMLEDVLSLVPSIAFLIATQFERRGASHRFSFGLKRVNSLAFLIAAVALMSIGGFLAFEATMTLVRGHHASIGTLWLFGQPVWLGWVMIAALVYSAIPPMLLGRAKLPLARAINDKVLHTDALTQRADWQTALAGVLGVLGIGLGWWWADAAAALFIALSIARDGLGALAKAATELIDGYPQSLERKGPAVDAEALEIALRHRFPDADVRIRESGRYMLAQLVGVAPPSIPVDLDALMPPGRGWRLAQISFVPPGWQRDGDPPGQAASASSASSP